MSASVQTWFFPLDGSSPSLATDDTDPSDGNVATIQMHGDQYLVSLEGSYETLTLGITAPGFEQVAIVYAALLKAAEPYQ